MIVSGLTIESKKQPLHKKGQTTHHIQQPRPNSSELPEIQQLRAHTINKFHHIDPHHKHRNQSYNKIYMTNKINQKKQLNQLQLNMQQEPKIPSKNSKKKIKLQVGIRRSKKMQISKEEEFCQFEYEQKLLSFFRYYPISIIGVCGMRQQMMKSLVDKNEIGVYVVKSKKLPRQGIQEVWSKLIKTAMLKGKYKYRQKFNWLNSGQIKALGYKRKEIKKKKQQSSSSSEEEDYEKKEKCRDIEAWKRSMGVQGSKVFIVKGKYKDLRNALLERGWVENEDHQSLFYDLKWTTKVNDINFESVKPHQMVNHFNNNACLTSKYGICKSLRSIMFSESVDIDRFFPKAFDLSDIQDFENFIEIYKWNYCESILKTFSEKKKSIIKEEPRPPTKEEQRPATKEQQKPPTKEEQRPIAKQQQRPPTKEEQIRIKLSYIVTYRRLLNAQKLIVNTLNSKYNLCSPNEWKGLVSAKDCEMDLVYETFQQWDLGEVEWSEFAIKCNNLLDKLKAKDPQFQMNGSNNIWIVKPAFLSRGRGIKCMSEFNDILDYGLGKETQYVVQKYIQNPLIINKRKFDIRQWVIVEDYSPPKIWFYAQFYVRFCLEDYNPNKLNNKFAHLTNNSVQKNNTKVNAAELANESMWSMDQLKEMIEQQYGEGKFKEIIAKMKEIVISTILSTQDQVYGRKNSFELVGYDFMIDDKLFPWLIEINSSPSMDYSTPITRRLVKMVLQDTVKVIVDSRKTKSKKKKAGLFKCIYDGESKYEFKHYKIAQQSQN